MIGLVIPIYNRHEYVAQCLDSLSKAKFPKDSVIVMIDDCSTDEYTIRMFESFQINGVRIIKLRNMVNKGVNYCLKATITRCLLLKCDVIINLDSDTLVKPDFISVLLKLRKKYPKNIVSGFHCKMLGNNGVERHPVISEHDDHYVKKSIGGVNMCFDAELYRKYISPSLEKPPDWDYYTCLFSAKDGKGMICTKPSVIQHIGTISSLGHDGGNGQVDISHDFDNTPKYKNKIIIPSQTHGIGDIIWEQTLIHHLVQDGGKVLWPVDPQFVDGLNQAYPSFVFINKDLLKADLKMIRNAEYNLDKNTIVLPLQWADTICKVKYFDNMKSKYIMYGMDWNIWKEKAMWTRHFDRENMLFDELGIKKGEKYNLINKYFRSANTGIANIKVSNELKNIDMKTIYGFSLFDWAKVIENATEIHTVSTSIIYMLELLELTAKEIDFRNIEYILQKHKYIFHLD